jgi:hypothetical protein
MIHFSLFFIKSLITFTLLNILYKVVKIVPQNKNISLFIIININNEIL